MSATHSRGPWTLDAESCTVFSASEKWPIADIWWRPEGPDKVTAEANAALMAKAWLLPDVATAAAVITKLQEPNPFCECQKCEALRALTAFLDAYRGEQ